MRCLPKTRLLFLCIAGVAFYVIVALLLKDDALPTPLNVRPLAGIPPWRWRSESPRKVYPYPYILKWTESKGVSRTTAPMLCGAYKCVATNDREMLPFAEAIMFTTLIDDLPLPRAPNQLWALSCLDFRYVPMFVLNTPLIDYFNYTSTFSRYSDLPLTTRRLRSFADITRTDYMVHLDEKRRLRTTQHLATVAYFDFGANESFDFREAFILDLRTHISVDMFGLCEHCQPLPKRLNNLMLTDKLDLYDPELLQFMARYKFIIGFEDGTCNDLVTEQYWLPLLVGAVPVYIGAPNVRDWEPHDKSAIYIIDFYSVVKLGAFIKQLDRDDVEYKTYLRHKYDLHTPITNKRLLAAITARQVDTHFADFQCYICAQVHRRGMPPLRRRAIMERSPLQNRLNCSDPMASPPMWQLDLEGLAEFNLNPSHCQALVMLDVLRRNKKISRQELTNLMVAHCHGDAKYA